MVRTTIACSRCRQQPIPHASRSRQQRHSIDVISPDDGSRTDEYNDQLHTRLAVSDCILDPALVLRAGTIFKDKFPEVPFLHMSTFRKLVKSVGRHGGNSGPSPAPSSAGFGRAAGLCAALLAITLPFTDPQASRIQYVNIAKETISLDESMDIYTVQTLIILAIHEWGNGKPRQAWIYSGMAIRSMQLISPMADSDKCTELQQEIYNRTFWSCFVLDRLIFCGKPQPPALPLASVDTHWPSRETDYAFGLSGVKWYPNKTVGIQSTSVVEYVDGYFSLLVQGVDIWAEILRWIVSGGRRHPDVVTARETPWSERSHWWRMYQRLDSWRQRHGSRIRFPDVGVDGHVSLRGGDGEAFVYINLIYHVSILFLCREYIPFLPTPASRPSGPVDPPLLDEPAPIGWWENRASELFFASSNITSLLHQLKEEGTPLITPFAGFCAFSAATMNIYVACFPQMNLGRSQGREADAGRDLAYLDEFQERWPMGAGWWATIQRTKDLIQRASVDWSGFEGKTRADFVNLETSIHDCTGLSPKNDEHCPENDRAPTESVNDQVTLRLQEPSQSNIASSQSLSNPQAMPDWHELWSLWGDHNLAPFGVEGSSYEYSLAFQDGNMSLN
ncbi:hypothetical protein UA08_04957 [Talaromyces atroroseus]|uniref:Xylanolytic transcriptional activator regulatory domain-containing protein n=1 Tax=Talaromyces atroroseus TaxID=1441469 RepID=A0A225AZ61_TALAT|nr:hypothetical protein UA08_04957 [Talaromyces atroroseus]OKL59765.1 hypothetical protein UA08_04957 [Talaromyces atroroseus]